MGLTLNRGYVGGSGSYPTIEVTITNGTAASVTATLGSTVVNLTYDSTAGVWRGTLKAFGTWMVEASNGEKTVSDTVDVTNVAVYTTSLQFSPLPSGYTELEYIEGGGPNVSYSISEISCIDTGIVPTETTRVVTSSKGEGESGWISSAYQEAFYWSCMSIGVSYNASDINPGGSSSVVNTYDLTGNGNLFFNGTNIGTGNIGNTASSGQTIYLMAVHVEWTSSGFYATGTLQQHRCQIYSGATLVRDLYPARRNSDSVLGMYDLVNHMFHTNAGFGSFIAGPDV